MMMMIISSSLLWIWDGPYTDFILLLWILVLSVLLYYQQQAYFRRPVPVPKKVLPKRPILQLLFQPHDVNKNYQSVSNHNVGVVSASHASVVGSDSVKNNDAYVDAGVPPPPPPPVDFNDYFSSLPDSFAPLLSSNRLEILWKSLCIADLVHAVDVRAGMTLNRGLHIIPLDADDSSRPQLTFGDKDQNIQLNATLTAGCDYCSSVDKDFNTNLPINERSKTLVKTASLSCDKPLPIDNIVPTLLNLPRIFEYNHMKRAKSFREKFSFLFRIFLWFLNLIEKCLWILERKCKVYLFKIHAKISNDRVMTLQFSGYVLVWNFLPIPFASIALPSSILPRPYALLEKLLTDQPLATAKVKHSNLSSDKILLSLSSAVKDFHIQSRLLVTPPALGVDVTLAGGVALAVEAMIGRDGVQGYGSSEIEPYDANKTIPWLISVSANGAFEEDQVKFNVSNVLLTHDASSSAVALSGYYEIFKSSPKQNGGQSFPMPGSVASLLIQQYTSKTKSLQRRLQRVLQYNYSFELDEINNVHSTKLDAVSMSIGASHRLLQGGTLITTVFEQLSCKGSFRSKPDAYLDILASKKKRDILRHLPVVNIIVGIQNVFIPPNNKNYSDDGWHRYLPDLQNGRIRLQVLGGVPDDLLGNNESTQIIPGIRFVCDFFTSSFDLKTVSHISEFPELEIYNGDVLKSKLRGTLGGCVVVHLRPAKDKLEEGEVSENPLESYEIDFSDSKVTFTVKECHSTIGHRRMIVPSEATISVNAIRSVLDMKMEGGGTLVECSWDFQGSSPILQSSIITGLNPAYANHEDKLALPIIIPALRQGRVCLEVSSVGGINFKQASTGREFKDGLYDWKFFNALVSADSPSNITVLSAILQDKRTMNKLLAICKLVSADLHFVLQYMLHSIWRAQAILDKEGIRDPGHAIPRHKTARLLSLLLAGDLTEFSNFSQILNRVNRGDGLDIVQIKLLLQKHVGIYDRWISEFDRILKVAALMLGPMSAPAPYVEVALPLSEMPKYKELFRNIPSAKEMYSTLLQKEGVLLDSKFSAYVARVSPYLSFRQVEYLLTLKDWHPNDLRRLNYVYSIKRKVLEFSESYGGLSFLPQSYFVSIFVAEASRSSLRTRKAEGYDYMLIGPKSSKLKEGKKARHTLSTLRKKSYDADREDLLHSLPPTSSRSLNEDSNIEYDYLLSPASRRASGITTVSSQLNGIHVRPLHPVSNSHVKHIFEDDEDGEILSSTFAAWDSHENENSISPPSLKNIEKSFNGVDRHEYCFGDSLLGPTDVAILLQAGLASAQKGSTVVQLNQRMLLDLIASQPDDFAIAVLAEIGTPGGHGSPRVLASALMAFVELEQSSFLEEHRLDMHALLESWLPGYKLPRREDYLAGGRWARQSYYDAIYQVSENILTDAEPYMAVKGHIQKVRHSTQHDLLSRPKEFELIGKQVDMSTSAVSVLDKVTKAKASIDTADKLGAIAMQYLFKRRRTAKISSSDVCQKAIKSYREAFDACSALLEMDPLAFQSHWFKAFWRRNYDALMIYSVYENVINNVDSVRDWLDELKGGSERAKRKQRKAQGHNNPFLSVFNNTPEDEFEAMYQEKNACESTGLDILPLFDVTDETIKMKLESGRGSTFFLRSEKRSEQELLEVIIDVLFYDETERVVLLEDPLVRLLIPNPPGKYKFTIVSAMGIVTEGRRGRELSAAFARLKVRRGVDTIRADTGTARSFEYNASKIEEAINEAVNIYKKPYGMLGYSQGCANILMAESSLLSGSPTQQKLLCTDNCKLVSRQLLFSAANGSMHGEASNTKAQKLIVMCEDALKYHQGYFSRAFISSTLDFLNGMMDSAPVQRFFGGAHSMLPDGVKAFWREAQHLPNVPTCVLRGVLEEHTTPESLEMTCSLLTKQSGSGLHDSQVHVYDAVGHPIYTKNRNGKILEACDMGGSIQRTHHWSPLEEEVDFLRTTRDENMCTFDCAKDRHVFPWVDVNARFGIIRYEDHD